eukprot:CAMPEP_0201866770 /NCGR_PEP_ID=MMETSP0902-20130614/1236_1 /ASSEMBLY_ACC=CAM_ASM_000551 /TAXON_ID=420261 /ORGANISM="Thalassiosira antarctica, Strain CCMP982" /LENGTH=1631 /DNA_ID=CAMNT_0048391801 /DNA_START=121 /DNA_END=5016 /DNA_ORIENTATION=+
MAANTPPTVPSTNEDDNNDNPSAGNTNNWQQQQFALPSIPSQVEQDQQPIGSAFSSPRLNNNNPSYTPLLNGENIVLLSFSNDTTPVDTPVGGVNSAEMMAGQNVALGPVAAGIAIFEQGNEDNNHEDEDEELNDMTLSPSSFLNVENYAHSPPPESIYSDQLTALSPPPISMKSSSSNHMMGGPQQTSSGSQSLFTRDSNSHNHRGPIPTVASSVGKKKRPPLPPRWAIGGGTNSHHAGMNNNYYYAPTNPNNPPPHNVTSGVGVGAGGMVDVVPSHLPPPKQIVSSSHRRVLSTGDASFLSNLTDPESIDPDDHSPPLANAAAGGMRAVAPVLVPHSTTNVTSAFQPLPIMGQSSSRKPRGVSWDFGSQMIAHAASHSVESDGGSFNRYKNEEEAAFDTLGILQPIFQDDTIGDHGNVGGGSGGTNEVIGDTINLMQPILMDDDEDNNIMKEPMVFGGTSSAFTASPLSPGVVANQSPPSPPPPTMPLPEKVALPEKVVKKQKHKSKQWSLLEHHVNANLSPKAVAKSKNGKDMASIALAAKNKNDKENATQFEDEADLAIRQALEACNMQQSINTTSHEEEEADGERKGDRLTPVDDDESEEDDEPEDDVPSQVVPKPISHRQDVSGITTHGFDNNSPKEPPPTSVMQHSREVSIFEDSTWTEGYDAAGRVDGTLPEEGVDLNPSVAAAAVAAARPPLHPLLSSKNENVSGRSIFKRAVSDDSASRAKSNEAPASKSNVHVPKDPTETTGLRHRRKKTIAAKNMADEMAQLAALHGGDGGNNNEPPSRQHQRSQTGDGGIDNLFAGVDILGQQDDESSSGDYFSKHHDHHDHHHPATGTDGEVPHGDDTSEGDTPHDEETGNVSRRGSPHSRRPWSPRSTMGRSSRYSEMYFHLSIWYHDLIKPKLPGFVKGATHSIVFVIVPLLTVSFILYYALDNPMAGQGTVDDELGFSENASWSWWVIFLVRQAFLLSCVKAGEVISIDILALRTPLFLKTIGSFATLMIVQARGWPYVLTFWSLMDFCFLFGTHSFAKHWLFWQDWIAMFTASNPAGNFLFSNFYIRILLAMMFVGVSTSLKRLWLATFLGRRSFAHYGPELEIILAKMLLVSQVAHLARQITAQVVTSRVSSGYAYTMRGSKNIALPGMTTDSEDDSPTQKSRKSFDELSRGGSAPQNGFGQSLLDAGIGSKLVSSLSRPRLESSKSSRLKASKKRLGSSSKLEIMALLEEWEEPDIKTNAASKASIKDILQFRQAVSLMSDLYPFTPAFGPAKTRPMCVESSEELFLRLQRGTSNTSPLLPFETLSEIAYDGDGTLIRDKVKALIKLFRPDRKGFLTKLDFVSSIDNVYKDVRLFRASLSNASSIDDSFESIINLVFYVAAVIIILLIMGFQMWEPILSFSAFFFSFSFMFGPASSKYFEGILLIFIRRPYDIGDKIALSDPADDTSAGGSSTWFVEKVSLFTTTVRFATTNEVATYSNGSLARLRVINAKRSPKAIIYVYMKFGSDVSFQMIKVYQTAIENFVKSRPREWTQLNGFRATRVEMELNFVEYVIVATHREMWQNVGPILQSKADLDSFSLEVSKKLNLRYQNPPKPVHLSLTKGKKADESGGESYGQSEIQQVADLFGDADE